MPKVAQGIVEQLKTLGPLLEVEPLRHALRSVVVQLKKKKYRIDIHDVSPVVYPDFKEEL